MAHGFVGIAMETWKRGMDLWTAVVQAPLSTRVPRALSAWHANAVEHREEAPKPSMGAEQISSKAHGWRGFCMRGLSPSPPRRTSGKRG